MMTSNRPTGNLSIPSSSSIAPSSSRASSSSSTPGSVPAGEALHLLSQELSSVADREPPPPSPTTNTEAEASSSSSILTDPKATTSGSSTATNVMIVKTIRTAMAEIRRP